MVCFCRATLLRQTILDISKIRKRIDTSFRIKMMIFHINNVRSHPTKTLAGPYLWWSSWGETLIDLDAQRIRFLSHWSFIMLLTLIWELHLYLEFEVYYCCPVCPKISKTCINDSSWGYLTYLTSWSFLTSFKIQMLHSFLYLLLPLFATVA